MDPIKNNKPRPVIGVDAFYYAVLKKDEHGEALEYDPPKRLPGLVKVGWQPDIKTAAFHADNGVYENEVTMGEPKLAVQLAQVPPECDAELMGLKYSNGVIAEGEINPPYAAFGYRVKLAGGGYGYRWIMKGKMSPPNEDADTQGDTTTYQNASVEINCAKTVATGEVRRKIQDTDQNLPEGVTAETIAENWFTSPTWEPVPEA